MAKFNPVEGDLARYLMLHLQGNQSGWKYVQEAIVHRRDGPCYTSASSTTYSDTAPNPNCFVVSCALCHTMDFSLKKVYQETAFSTKLCSENGSKNSTPSQDRAGRTTLSNTKPTSHEILNRDEHVTNDAAFTGVIGPSLCTLNDDCSFRLFDYLSPFDLFNLSATGTTLRQSFLDYLATGVSAFINRRATLAQHKKGYMDPLMPHQRETVAWMMNIELGRINPYDSGQTSNLIYPRDVSKTAFPKNRQTKPYLRYISTSCGIPICVNMLDCKLSIATGTDEGMYNQVKGGILADDTGLGKTVMIIALIHSSASLMGPSPTAPPLNSFLVHLIHTLIQYDSILGRGSFIEPVSRKHLTEKELAQYQKIIQRPMCLSAMSFKAISNEYASLEHVHDDLKLMLDNSYKWNVDIPRQNGHTVDVELEADIRKMEQAWDYCVNFFRPRAASSIIYYVPARNSGDPLGGRSRLTQGHRKGKVRLCSISSSASPTSTSSLKRKRMGVNHHWGVEKLGASSPYTGQPPATSSVAFTAQLRRFCRSQDVYSQMEREVHSQEILGDSSGTKKPVHLKQVQRILDFHTGLKAGAAGMAKAKRMLRSNATLVVVPHEDLVKQWEDRLRHFTPTLPVIHFYRSSDCLPFEGLFQRVRGPEGVLELAGGKEGESITIKRTNGKGLPAWEAKCVVVLSTLSFLSGSFGSKDVLKDIHWRRIVVDESQALGRTTMSSRLQLLCELISDFRWVMTGTPTADRHVSEAASDLTYLQQQLAFLREPVWSRRENFNRLRSLWLSKHPAGWAWVKELFGRVAIRHDKESITFLRSRTEYFVDFKMKEGQVNGYNSLVAMAARNLMYTHYDRTHRHCYLSPTNAKYAKQFLDDIRRACCVAGHIQVKVPAEDVLHVRDMIQRSVLTSMSPSEVDDLISVLCDCCNFKCSCCLRKWPLPILTPCAHVLCVTCANTDVTFPPIPSQSELQRIHPGAVGDVLLDDFEDESTKRRTASRTKKSTGEMVELTRMVWTEEPNVSEITSSKTKDSKAERNGSGKDEIVDEGVAASCFRKVDGPGRHEEGLDPRSLSLREYWLRRTFSRCPVPNCHQTFRAEDIDQLQVGYGMHRGTKEETAATWTSEETAKVSWLVDKLGVILGTSPAESRALSQKKRGACILLYSTLTEHHVLISEALERTRIPFVRYSKTSDRVTSVEAMLFHKLGLKRRELNREALCRFNRAKDNLGSPLLPFEDTESRIKRAPSIPGATHHQNVSLNTDSANSLQQALLVPESIDWILQISGTGTIVGSENGHIRPFEHATVTAKINMDGPETNYSPCRRVQWHQTQLPPLSPYLQSSASNNRLNPTTPEDNHRLCGPIVVVLSLDPKHGDFTSDSLSRGSFVEFSGDGKRVAARNTKVKRTWYKAVFGDLQQANESLRILEYVSMPFLFGKTHGSDVRGLMSDVGIETRLRSRQATISILCRRANSTVASFDFRVQGNQGDGDINEQQLMRTKDRHGQQIFFGGDGVLDSRTKVIAVEEPVRVMLMDQAGAEALDLNHTTHIFIMEPILDKGEENQVVGRAYRFSTESRPVEVYKLYVKDTVEELIYKSVLTSSPSPATLVGTLSQCDRKPLQKGQQLRNLLFQSLSLLDHRANHSRSSSSSSSNQGGSHAMSDH